MKIPGMKGWDDALENEKWTAPDVDIFEENDCYILIANMPGVSKEGIKIKVEESTLYILGRIDYDAKQGRNYVLDEIEGANFFRKFKISKNIEENKIDAQLENGQLTVRLPKQDNVKPRVIEIK